MKDLSTVTKVIAGGVIGAMLAFFPLMLSAPALLIWSFLPPKPARPDAYVRISAALVLIAINAWLLGAILPTYLGRSGLVQYGAFMVEAGFEITIASIVLAALLAGSGVWALHKGRRLMDAHPGIAE
jgi:hypothetical protein